MSGLVSAKYELENDLVPFLFESSAVECRVLVTRLIKKPTALPKYCMA
jgi:hypothetical protein